MNKSFIIKKSIIAGLLIALFLTGYAQTPLSGLMPLIFIGLTITFASGASVNEVPNYIASVFSGIVWGGAIFLFDHILKSNGVDLNLSFFIESFVLGTGICLIHMCVLEKSWFNRVPFCFAPVCCLYITGGTNYFGIVLTLISGILLAVAIEPLARLTTSRSKKAYDAEEFL